MKQHDLLSILCCPEDHSELTPIDSALLSQINAGIRGGQLVNRAGKRVQHQIEGGLLRTGGDLLYPMVNQIPVLIREEAILVSQLASGKPN